MLNKSWYFILIVCCIPVFTHSQGAPPKISVEEYIAQYKDVAIAKMREHRIPASISLAQGILESANGNSELAVFANNHFGIKCHREWTGETYLKDDDEKDECFRKYKNAAQSFEDHSHFLQTRPRYAFLFEMSETDYKSWAYGLKKAGYATNPNYPALLIRIIEENRLYEYDQAGTLPVGKNFSFTIDSLPKEYKALVDRDEGNEISFDMVNRKVWKNNGIKFTLAKRGDDVIKIARELDLMTWQLTRYNELSSKNDLQEGQIIYLQPKKRRAARDFHTVQENETMYTISQLYGIKLKHLYRKNRMEKGSQPIAGQKLWLRKLKPDAYSR